ncbi:MAG: hypothetical protein H6510_17185 [Acidobacteria bacterium]|nr:hypothetical protein [Acidobacteriota bacterium]MCB9399549.1 hypothetical protein [Acidobacteriota bacterium]
MTEKKGMPVWGWALIGCGGITLIGIVAVVGLGFWASKKVNEFAKEMDENPGLATAKIYDMANPDVELVDYTADSYTFKNTKTGEEVTVTLEDIENGKISFKTKEGESTISFNEAEGGVSVETPEGSMTISKDKIENLPEWVPQIPNSQVSGHMNSNSQNGVSGTLILTYSGDFDQAVQFYREKLQADGFELTETTFSSENISTQYLVGTISDENRSCSVNLRSEQPVQIQIIYSQEEKP